MRRAAPNLGGNRATPYPHTYLLVSLSDTGRHWGEDSQSCIDRCSRQTSTAVSLENPLSSRDVQAPLPRLVLSVGSYWTWTMKHKRGGWLLSSWQLPFPSPGPDRDAAASCLIFTGTLYFSNRKLKPRKVKNVACPLHRRMKKLALPDPKAQPLTTTAPSCTQHDFTQHNATLLWPSFWILL